MKKVTDPELIEQLNRLNAAANLYLPLLVNNPDIDPLKEATEVYDQLHELSRDIFMGYRSADHETLQIIDQVKDRLLIVCAIIWSFDI